MLAILMLVGKTPEYVTFAWGFAGGIIVSFHGWNEKRAVLCHAVDRRKQHKPDIYTIIIVFFLFLLFAGIIPVVSRPLFGNVAEKMVAYAPQARKFQMEMENTLEATFLMNQENSHDVINNRTPKYRNKEIMKVTLKGEPPKGNQYFRGFFGMNYVNGKWVTDDSTFQRACKEAGYEEKKIAKFLALPAHEYYKKRKGGMVTDIDRMIPQRDITLSYTGLKSGYTYLPYMLGEIEGTDSSGFEKDYSLEKDAFQNEFHFKTWDFGYLDSIDYDADDAEVLYEKRNHKEIEWMNWYDDYVSEHYLEIDSDRLPSVPLIAENIRQELGWEEDGRVYVTSDSENIVSMVWAEIVHYYLGQNSYNLELDAIFDGTDPIEYFLTESHEGYCVHFASAGTLLLRKLGVPARYASGYVVHQYQWERNKDGRGSSSRRCSPWENSL